LAGATGTHLPGTHLPGATGAHASGTGAVALRAGAGAEVGTLSAPAAIASGGAAARAALVAIVAAHAIGSTTVTVAASLAPAVIAARAITLLDALLQALEAVQDLLEFAFDAGSAAGIRSFLAGVFAHLHPLRERGADEGQNGECGDSSHFVFVTPERTHMFRV
jgi:hypothetical protein